MASAAPQLGSAFAISAMIRALTIASLFAGGLKVTLGVDLRLSYLLVVVAYASILFLTPRPLLPVRPLGILAAWLIWNLAATVLIGPDLLFAATLPQVLGIGFFASFFFIFFANSRLDAATLFESYVRVAIWVALLGVPILVYTGLTADFWRLKSVFAEPAHYATTMTPATAYALATARKAPGRAAILGGAMLLTLSLTGFIGLGLTLAFVVGRRWYTRVALGLIGLAFLFGAYAASPEIRMRIDDTARVATTADFAEANLSTYALLSNLYVAWSAFSENPLLGAGLGSHKFSHDRFIGQLDGLETFEEYLEQNKQDANSLLARTLSEQGLVGIFLIFLFMWRFRRATEPAHQPITSAIQIYFLLKLIRDGHYFTPEFFYMVGIYYLLASKRQELPGLP